MHAEDDEDRQLVAGIVLGDEASLRALMRKYSLDLYHFAFSILGRRELTDEAVANVFISIWQRREALQINTSVRTYLFSAANNHAFKLLRDHVHPEDIPIDDVPAQDLVENKIGDSEVRYRECLEQIEALLQTMPLQRRRIFKMNRIENLRYKEIAAILGISVAAVQRNMDIAKQQIAEIRAKLGRRLWRDAGP